MTKIFNKAIILVSLISSIILFTMCVSGCANKIEMSKNNTQNDQNIESSTLICITAKLDENYEIYQNEILDKSKVKVEAKYENSDKFILLDNNNVKFSIDTTKIGETDLKIEFNTKTTILKVNILAKKIIKGVVVYRAPEDEFPPKKRIDKTLSNVGIYDGATNELYGKSNNKGQFEIAVKNDVKQLIFKKDDSYTSFTLKILSNNKYDNLKICVEYIGIYLHVKVENNYLIRITYEDDTPILGAFFAVEPWTVTTVKLPADMGETIKVNILDNESKEPIKTLEIFINCRGQVWELTEKSQRNFSVSKVLS